MKTLKEIIEAFKKGEQIDFAKVDFAAIGINEAALKEILAEIKPADTVDKLELASLDLSKLPKKVLEELARPMIDAARKEEKQTLYSTIEEIKKANGKLLADLEERKKAEADAQKAIQEKEEAEKLAKMSSADALKELERRYQELLDERQQTFSTELEKVKQDATAEKLRLYREKLLASAGNAIVPELLTGSSTEELDAAFELAKSKYKEIEETVAKRVLSEQEEKKKAEQEEVEAKKKVGAFFNRNSVTVEPGRTASGGANAPLDRVKLAKASKDELATIKDSVLAKYGL